MEDIFYQVYKLLHLDIYSFLLKPTSQEIASGILEHGLAHLELAHLTRAEPSNRIRFLEQYVQELTKRSKMETSDNFLWLLSAVDGFAEEYSSLNLQEFVFKFIETSWKLHGSPISEMNIARIQLVTISSRTYINEHFKFSLKKIGTAFACKFFIGMHERPRYSTPCFKNHVS